MQLFQRYKDAKDYAFGGNGNSPQVSSGDKETYWNLYQNLSTTFENILASSKYSSDFVVRAHNYSRERGVRGHRPKSIWCAFRNKDSRVFNQMPQIYVVLSADRFAVSIPEIDYHDQNVKIQNREIIPQIHKKLPISGNIVDALQKELDASEKWSLRHKTREKAGDVEVPFDNSISKMFLSLKQQRVCFGGGSIASNIEPDEEQNSAVDIYYWVKTALNTFGDILLTCAPTNADIEFSNYRNEIEKYSTEDEVYKLDKSDTRERHLRSIALRVGQGKFRNSLIAAYSGQCAFSKTSQRDVSQAAHIYPYKGKSGNNVANGILLRSDLHLLFDLHMISVNPKNFTICVSDRVEEEVYKSLEGKKIVVPERQNQRPSGESLAWHYDQYQQKKNQ